MGVVGERRLQDILDHMEFEIKNGTPRDIASRDLFEKCAKALEGKEALEEEVSKLTAEIDELETDQKMDLENIADLEKGRKRLEELLETERGKMAQLGEDLKEARALVGQLSSSLTTARAGAEQLARERDAAHVRVAELEGAGAGVARERIMYLETGLRRLMLEAFKLRKGVL